MRMKKITILAIILSLFTTICIDLQGRTDEKKGIVSGWRKIVDAEPKSFKKPTIAAQTVAKSQDDTIYCLSTRKKYMWQVPNEIISKEDAINRPFAIRLSNKNKEGYFCSLEILGKNFRPLGTGMTLTISHFLPDSIVSSSDIIRQWSTLHRLNLISDYTGKHVLQERFYDVNNNLLGYTVNQYSDNYNRVTECYFGPNGLPVKVTDADLSLYGLQLNVIHDRDGNDSISYLTDKGVVVTNKDGAYYLQQIHTHDNNGKEVRITRSLDANYAPMIDKYGNCGAYTILDRYGNDSISTFIDEYDNYMILPETSYDKNHINVSSGKYSYYYDINKLKSMEYFGLNGEPCQNILGTHKILVEYDSVGNETLRKGLNLKGELSPIDEYGVAKYTVAWDTFGNVKEYHQFDIDNKPTSPNGTNSSYYNHYDSITRQLTSNICYTYNEETGREEIIYKYLHSPSSEYTLYTDGSSKTVRYDTLGRETSIIFLDKFGKPDENTYCAIDSTQHISGNGISKSINREFRANRLLKNEVVYDSLSNIKSYAFYDEEGNKTDSYQHRYSKDGKFIGQTDCGEFGTPCRAGSNGGVRYLYIDVSMTLDGSYNAFKPLDEFGEPDYLISSDGKINTYWGGNESRYGGLFFYDEHGSIIEEGGFKTLRDKLPKVMSIEVVDSVAYDLGLRDNDIILSYGDYSVDLTNPLPEDQFKVEWTVRSVLDASKVKDMVVFRVEDAKAGKYGLKTICGLQGSPSELGFIPHIRYLTERQTERIVGCIGDRLAPLPTIEKDNYVVIDYPEMYRLNRFTSYAKEIKDATILLGAYDFTRGYKYDYRDSDNTDDIIKITTHLKNEANKHELKLNFYFAKNDNTIANLKSAKPNIGLNLVGGNVSDSDYYALKSMYEEVASKIDLARASKKDFNVKKLEGYWVVQEANDSSKPSAERYIYIDKDGECFGRLTAYSYIPNNNTYEEKYGSPIFRMDKSFNGTLTNADSLIIINSDKEVDGNIQCVSILEPQGDQSDIIAYFNEGYAKYRSYYNKKLLPYCGFNGEFFIKAIDKGSMIIDDGCGNELRLIKKKGKPDCISEGTLLGNWMYEDSITSVILSFNEEHRINMDLIVTIGKSNLDRCAISLNMSMNGDWSMDNDIVSAVFEPSSFNYKYDFLNLGLDEALENETRTELEKYLEKALQDIIKSLGVNDSLYLKMSKDGELQVDDVTLKKIPSSKEVAVGSIDGQEGFLVKSGFTGMYSVLQWCDWNCNEDIEAFGKEFESKKDKNKTLILLPITADENGNDVFGDPIEMECPAGLLGLRIRPVTIDYPYFIKHVRSRYKMLK